MNVPRVSIRANPSPLPGRRRPSRRAAAFDFRPGKIIEALGLQQGGPGGRRYQDTAAYGHFGRPGGKTFTWEEPREIRL